MKRILIAIIALSGALIGSAQTDTTGNDQKSDTIKVGGMIIIKKHGNNDVDDHKEVTISNHHHNKKVSNVTTNWWIVDLGFANWNDKSDYAAAQAQGFVGAGLGKDQLNLRTGKSVDVNVWVFMQRLNIVKHVVNLKYGLGLELNNYRFDNEQVRLSKDPTSITIDQTLKDVKKNKLAVDYITVPLMLNFNFTPGREKGFSFSGGISAGYLYSAREKIKYNNNHKTKLHGNFDLERWKLSYVGELNLGPVKLFGSYALKSMWEKGLDQTPYAIGIRFSSW